MRFSRMQRLAAAFLVVAAGATAAAAQDEWTRQIDDQFERFEPSVRERGLQPRGGRRYGRLDDDASERIEVAANAPTLFVALCDNDCTNLDLVLVDAGGAVVDSDVLDDDYPMVSVDPAGTYRLEVRMTVCSASPCRYGVQAYSR